MKVLLRFGLALVLVSIGALAWWLSMESDAARAPRSGEQAATHVEPALRSPDATHADGPAPSSRTIRFPVEQGSIPAPADGYSCRVRLVGFDVSFDRTGVMRAGRLEVADAPDGGLRGIAFGPQGTAAQLECWIGTEQGQPTAFRKATRLEVQVVDGSGSPAPDIDLKIGSASDKQPDVAERSKRTGDDGVAVWEALEGNSVTLVVRPPSDWGRWETGDAVPLEGGVQRVRHVLHNVVPFEISFSRNGEPVKPSAAPQVRFGNVRPQQLRLDDASGVLSGYLVAACDPGDVWPIEVRVGGFQALFREVTLPARGETMRLQFELVQRGFLTVGPNGSTKIDMPFRLERKLPGGWRFVVSARIEAASWMTFGDLPAGEYRVVLGPTQSVYGPVEVRAGERASISVDTRMWNQVKGRVVVPQGARLNRAEIWMHTRDGRFALVDNVRRDGRFSVWLPPGGPYRLEVRHPDLIPHATLGAVEVAGPRSGLTLRLVGTTGTFTFEHLSSENDPGTTTFVGRVEVRLYAPGDRSKPINRWLGVLPGRFTAHGFAPGRYDVWIDYFGHVPLVRAGVTLAAAHNDLGQLSFETGSTITVDFGRHAPLGALIAMRDGPPPLFRVGRIAGPRAHIRGLPAGTWFVSLRGVFESEVEVDGRTDVVLTLDLRTK